MNSNATGDRAEHGRDDHDAALQALTEDLKARARILHRAAQRGDADARAALRRVPELRKLPDAAPEAAQLDARAHATFDGALKRRHALTAIAIEHGFRDWSHALEVLSADAQVADFGTTLYPSRCSAHWNIWSASYDEASGIRAEHGGFLLAYKHQFLIVDQHYIETLGLAAADPDWALIARDWVRPAHPGARRRLYAKLLGAAR